MLPGIFIMIKKRIMLIGSKQFFDKMHMYKRKLEDENCIVTVPAFDNHPEFDTLEICEYNRDLMEHCDEVHIIWDQRSIGTIFDFGMCFAMRKPFRIAYLGDKTFIEAMRGYEESCFPKGGDDMPKKGKGKKKKGGKGC